MMCSYIQYLRLWISLKYTAETLKTLRQHGSFLPFTEIRRVDVNCKTFPTTLLSMTITIRKKKQTLSNASQFSMASMCQMHTSLK